MTYSSIVITGGAGFIGSNLAVYLKTRYPRARVTAVDNLKRRGSQLNLARLHDHGVKFLHGDIRAPEDLRFIKSVDLVLECSAEPSVVAGYSDDPAYMVNTNLTGAVNCFELARRHKADILFFSTSRVYPFAAVNALRFREEKTRFSWSSQEHPGFGTQGINAGFPLAGARTLYGATKLAAEQILIEYLNAYGFKGVINRLGVVAGPWQFGRIDQGVFTYWMLAHYFKKPLSYIGFGARGKQVRDLLHIDDLCDLVNKQLQRLPQISGRIYNAGGGTHANLSLCEATELCRRITGTTRAIGRDRRQRPGDVRIYITDNAAVSGDLRWKPQKSAREILQDISSWIGAHQARLKDTLIR